ncbi:MAG: DNA polymerase III subunit epsilon [Notoacmeibacter sp.]
MREIIFDTETTGLDPKIERIIEIGAVELENRFPTGRTFHHYLYPDGRKVDPAALAVHGISDADLVGKPLFSAIAEAFLEFVGDGKLVAHNAGFDKSFLNAELERINRQPVPDESFIDTLAIARRRHPMGPNSLDALCKRYGVSNAHRTKHGALLDSELLAEVYIEMSGGRQAGFSLNAIQSSVAVNSSNPENVHDTSRLPSRPTVLPPRITASEKAAHDVLVSGLGDEAVWKRYQ